jgi:hypothetical protein
MMEVLVGGDCSPAVDRQVFFNRLDQVPLDTMVFVVPGKMEEELTALLDA